MKKFALIAIAMVGLSACASSDSMDYEGRTAGSIKSQIEQCNERVRRLEQMNKACYRK